MAASSRVLTPNSAGQLFDASGPAIPHHIEPGREHGAFYPGGDQDAAVEAGTVGVEPLQPVDGREAGFGVLEGEKFPVQVPPRLHPNPGRRASKRSIGEDLKGGVTGREYGGNDETPQGSPHRV